MALTDNEASVIRATWTPIRSTPATWPRLFIILFTDEPELQKQFKSFANVPLEELSSNKRLKAHVASVVTLLTGFVDFLDDSETMVEMIENMASRHFKRNVPLKAFDTLGVALMKWLKETQGAAMNDEAVTAWTKLYAALVSIVKDQYKKLVTSSS